MTNSIQPIIVIGGATGSGKSALALSLAEKRRGVIINADSQQMYKELCILTARPSAQEEAQAEHKLYGMLSADEPCSAGKWLTMARMEIDWAHSQNKTPIVVGGTGLYLKALMEGIAEIPDIDPTIRQQAMNDYDAMGKDAFAERLRAADPQFFERLKVVDKQRLIRAYEVWLGSGKPLSWWQSRDKTPLYPAEAFEVTIVDLPREALYARCDARFIRMLEQGALEEVKGLWSNGVMGSWKNTSTTPLPHHPTTPLLKVIGVPELLAHLRGELTLQEATAKAQQATRNYAKRQVTWFKHQLVR